MCMHIISHDSPSGKASSSLVGAFVVTVVGEQMAWTYESTLTFFVAIQ